MERPIGCHLSFEMLVNPHMPASSAQRSEASTVGFNVVGLMLLLALAGIGLAYGIDAMSRAGHQPAHRPGAETVLTRTLADRRLHIPVSWFREAAIPADGFARQVDLRLNLPLGPEGAPRSVDVMLVPRSRAQPSALLLDRVYLHQFQPAQLAGPPGLVGKPLAAADGFTGETVWYDPLSADPFVAKCSVPVAPGAGTRCLRTVRFGNIAAVYAFDSELLPAWRQFDDRMRPLLAAIGID